MFIFLFLAFLGICFILVFVIALSEAIRRKKKEK
jgi:cbb3-type cytochrome oxidase subunit 3